MEERKYLGGAGDTVDRAFRMILADDRRPLDEDAERAAKALWRRVFSTTPEKALLQAVQAWLQENPKGRPNIGKVAALLKDLSPGGGGRSSDDDDRSGGLRWAVNLLEAHERNYEFRERIEQPAYRHSLESAEQMLRRRGYSSWQDARAHLEPGWAPPTTTEVIL